MQRLLTRVVDVRAGEAGALALGFAGFFCLLCSYYLLRPLRDALGLAGGADELQWLFTATFLAMLGAVPAFGALASRRAPLQFVPWVYRFFALHILAFGALFALGRAEVWVARVFFVWTSVFNLFVVSVFWSVMVDLFGNAQGRRLFGFISAGGTAGALVGPALTAAFVDRLGPAGLVLLSALLLEGAVRCVQALRRHGPRAGDAGAQPGPEAAACPGDGARSPGEPGSARRDGNDGPGLDRRLDGGGALAGLAAIARSRYLQGIVAYILLLTGSATFLYFEQARIVAAEFADTASRARFFAGIDLAVGALTLGLQLAGTARAIRRFGTVLTLCVLPLVTALAAAALLAAPVAAVLVAAQALRRAADYALARPVRELLFTVVERESRYKAKSAIDTVVYRGGDAASGWLFAALAGLGAGGALPLALLIPASAAWVALSAALARRQENRAASQERLP